MTTKITLEYTDKQLESLRQWQHHRNQVDHLVASYLAPLLAATIPEQKFIPKPGDLVSVKSPSGALITVAAGEYVTAVIDDIAYTAWTDSDGDSGNDQYPLDSYIFKLHES